MSDGGTLLIAFFLDEEPCLDAIEQLKTIGYAKPRVFAPFPSERIPEVLHLPQSRVRLWVLLGALLGCASGFALCIGLSADYPHRTAGMPIVSIPPFVVIAFELTVLCGALCGLIGFLLLGGFPHIEQASGYDPRFTDDRFGVVVECAPADRVKAEQALRRAGAVEVQHDEA